MTEEFDSPISVPHEAEMVGGDSCFRKHESRNKGPQPLAQLMAQLHLKPHDLVEASTEQLTHKMVARAMKGRQLTINARGIVQRAFNRATSKSWTQAQLFNY